MIWNISVTRDYLFETPSVLYLSHHFYDLLLSLIRIEMYNLTWCANNFVTDCTILSEHHINLSRLVPRSFVSYTYILITADYVRSNRLYQFRERKKVLVVLRQSHTFNDGKIKSPLNEKCSPDQKWVNDRRKYLLSVSTNVWILIAEFSFNLM